MDMQLTRCDSKTKEDGISESDVLYSNRYQLTTCNSKVEQDGISETDVPHSNRPATYLL
jgi:hypothetical protein